MTMTPDQIEQAARIFDKARKGNYMIDEVPAELGLVDLDDAAKVAERVVELSGEKVVGFLVGATNPEMQKSLKTDEPYYACILESNLCHSPADLKPFNLLTIGLESEVAFTLGRDLPARDKPYSEKEVADAIRSIHASVEVVNGHIRDWLNKPIAWVMADNGTDGPLVLGPGVEDWRGIDRPNIPVTLTVNGKVECRGRGGNALGDPFAVMVWIANKRREEGRGMTAGQVVNTGTTAGIHFAKPGGEAVADFGPLGQAVMTF
jgi:2-keto-4-pentenoate hydratase